jgi:putative ABC transport system permease protein
MFFRFILRALAWRKQRLLLAFSALAVAATLATVLFAIYGTIDRRIRDEFRAYGANIVAVPVGGNTVPLSMAVAAEKLGAEAAPFLVTAARIREENIAVVGFNPAKTSRLTAYWHVRGSRDIHSNECLAGELLADRMHWEPGSYIAVGGRAIDAGNCSIKGIVSSGGAEDNELLVSFETAARLAQLNDVASVIEIRAPGERVESVRSALARQFPGADVRTVRSVAGTESNVALKIRGALFLLTLLILAITTLCVSSNFSEMVIERSREIGILKAMGAAERRIAGFFLSEAAALALASTVTGYIIGIFAAAAIGRQIFGGSFHVQVNGIVFITVAAVMLAVAAVATSISASRIWGIQPAIILRGD